MSYVVPIRPTALPAWQALGSALDEVNYGVPCRDRSELWSGEHATPETIAYAEAHCQYCPVMELCGAYADAANERNAVWGGRYRIAKRGRPAANIADRKTA